MAHTSTAEDIRCSFCGKSRFDVAKVVAGPGTFICNECIELCNQIIAQETEDGSGSSRPASRPEAADTPPLGNRDHGVLDELGGARHTFRPL